MKRLMVFIFLSAISGSLLLSGCVTQGAVQADSTSSLPTIYEKYSDRFEKTDIGMSFENFISVWADTYLVGKTNKISAYEFKDSQLYYTTHDKNIGIIWTGTIKTQEYTQKVWFYFVEDKLVKYGEPEHWPES